MPEQTTARSIYGFGAGINGFRMPKWILNRKTKAEIEEMKKESREGVVKYW